MTRIEAAGIINAIKCSMVTTLEEHEALTMAECVLFEAEPKPSYPISEEYYKAYKEGYEDGYKEAKEVFEPKHGEWIGCTDGTVLCSRCLETNEPTNFCPNCGADMREVKGGKV